MKHTQGKWEFKQPCCHAICVDGKIIASSEPETFEEFEQGSIDFKLMAAAPDLLEALELCRKHMYAHASNTEDGAFDKLCAAIKKAT